MLEHSVKSPGSSLASRSFWRLQLVPSSCTTRKNEDSCDAGNLGERVADGSGARAHLGDAQSADLGARQAGANVDGSTGSETTGVNVLHAISFQNSSLLPGSNPSVANVSNALIQPVVSPL